MEARGLTRRRFLRRGIGALGISLSGGAIALPVRAAVCGADGFGPLQPADANGLRLPPGFSSRIVATSGQLVAGTGYAWHGAPDGGATFDAGDGGWVYVSNSEVGGGAGGVGALRFDAAANLIAAYPILTGTSRNCAGGPTPWGTWLSCEERDLGRVYECDPLAPGSQGVLRPGCGSFQHEAAAVDPVHLHVYLTEDEPNGLLYRLTPSVYPDLSAGLLEAAEILDPLGEGPIAPGQVRPLAWHAVPNPNPTGAQTRTRHQLGPPTRFDGGEGCWYESGLVYFSTKGNHRVWRIDTVAQTIEIQYDLATTPYPDLENVDNVHATPCGDVYVAEDPGELRIVALTPTGNVKPIVQVEGVTGTELTGPALTPDGQRLYFSSQWNPGETFEVTGPFVPPARVPSLPGASGWAAAALLAAAGAWILRRREFPGIGRTGDPWCPASGTPRRSPAAAARRGSREG